MVFCALSEAKGMYINMEIYDAINLLQKKGIKLVEINGEIFHDERTTDYMPPYNHHGIICEDNEWYFAFSKVERVNTPKVEKIKKFDSKSEAVKFLFLKCLREYLVQKKILPNHCRDIEIWNPKVIREFLKLNDIPEKYFSCEKCLLANSMHYYFKEGLLYFEYIGYCGEPLARSARGFERHEESSVWNYSIVYISLLHMMEQYEKEINEKGIITRFNDMDRVVLLDIPTL
jgi:hypothetical protein